MKKILVSIVFVVFLMILWWQIRFMARRQAVEKWMVKTACENGELNRFYSEGAGESTDEIYSRMSLGLDEFHLTHADIQKIYGSGKQKKTFRLATRIGQKIIKACGNQGRNLNEARMFSAQIIRAGARNHRPN